MATTKLADISFNPCFNGTYSLTTAICKRNVTRQSSFNPCFNGTYSLTRRT
ncbi:hypothetical protein CLOBAR_01821 [Intestinibacter bartlettii DSM 16795]|nr:hypothetical protein CLOBAR_01821 [Intestinibacter bartlettii DSM 16795]